MVEYPLWKPLATHSKLDSFRNRYVRDIRFSLVATRNIASFIIFLCLSSGSEIWYFRVELKRHEKILYCKRYRGCEVKFVGMLRDSIDQNKQKIPINKMGPFPEQMAYKVLLNLLWNTTNYSTLYSPNYY